MIKGTKYWEDMEMTEKKMRKAALDIMEKRLAELRSIDKKWILKIKIDTENAEICARFNQFAGIATAYKEIGIVTSEEINDLIKKYA